jgi:S-DNA-T family DNA segregation ATPase FtsK/SpoIIIE
VESGGYETLVDSGAGRRRPYTSPAAGTKSEDDPGHDGEYGRAVRALTVQARVSLLDHRTGTGVTVRLSAEPDAPAKELAQRLREFAPSDGDLYLGSLPLSHRSTVAELGLVDGMIISVGGPGTSLVDRDGHDGIDLLVVGGPDAGHVVKLPPGRHKVGRDQTHIVALPDPEVSRIHAQIDVEGGAAAVTDLESENHTHLDGQELTERTPIGAGQYLKLGRTTLAVTAPEVADGALVRSADGTLIYNRKFRSALPEVPAVIEFPADLEEEPPPTISMIYLVLPVIAGVAMAAILSNPMFLMFALLGPISGVGGMIANRRQHRVRQARQSAKHADRLARANETLRKAVATETRNRRTTAPDPATLVRAARGPRHILWERRPNDPEFLELRIGLADQPSAVGVRGDTAPSEVILPDLPAVVSLAEVDSLGIAGPLAQARGIARTQLFQIATLHSPTDVRIVVISPEPAWSWTRWLPHTRATSDDRTLLIGADPASTNVRLEELTKLITARRKERTAYGGAMSILPRYVVLFDQPSRLDRARVAAILRDGPAAGVHAIIIEESEPLLPEEYAGATVAPDGDRLVLRIRNRPTLHEVREEIINPRYCELAARCLAPLRPEGQTSGSLPTSVRLLDLVGMPDPTPATIKQAWANSAARCRAAVGVSPSGTFTFELNDQAPHALVAGTSGAGKTEFVKTLLAGLAIENHPDDLQFLIIDFKGGGDFITIAQLPHMIDLVVNDKVGVNAPVQRALELLSAEIARRQGLVAKHGARDIGTYRSKRAQSPELPPLGRILVVADEFARFASDHPDLLEEIIKVAQVGRSLGIHLLLSTQLPRGAVVPQIKANVPVRVCFRVNPGDADDVIRVNDPEQIPLSCQGRGFIRYGEQPPTEVQSARIAIARPSVAAQIEPMTIDVEAWQTIGYEPPAPTTAAEAADENTDLQPLVEAMVDAALESGWVENAVPWPRPLPDLLRFSPNRAVVRDGDQIGAALGLLDDPMLQRHVPKGVMVGGRNVAVLGSSGSGRTTALRTVAAGFAHALPPWQLHIQVLDFGGGTLQSLRALPHVGTITDDLAIATRLLERLEDQIDERRQEFAAHGYANLSEQWAGAAPADRMPAIVLLVDGWSSLDEHAGHTRSASLADRVVQVLSRGASVGIQAVITGDRTLANHPVSRQIGQRFYLKFDDALDYGRLEVPNRSIPSPHLPGRALIPRTNGPIEVMQIAHVGRDATGATQNAAMRAIGAHLSTVAVPAHQRPLRLQPLPGRVELGPILEAGADPALRQPVPIGLTGDEGRALWVDLANCRPGIIVAGSPGSGRTTALRSIATALDHAGIPIVLCSAKPSELARCSGLSQVRATLDWHATSEDELLEALGDDGVLLLDDGDQLDAYDPLAAAAITHASESGTRVVVSVTTDAWKELTRGWAPSMKMAKHGLLLTPRGAMDSNAVGHSESLTTEQRFSRPAGRGLWLARGAASMVQSPLV